MKRIIEKRSNEAIIEKRSNEAVVCLHLSTQHTWPQLYACLSSIVCPFCISSRPQLGQRTELMRKLTRSPNRAFGGGCRVRGEEEGVDIEESKCILSYL
jgi:hypothetical protein